MNKRKKILVTNDDGITAPGIKSLVEALRPLGDILVVAPDKPQSGMGHAITVNQPLRLQRIEDYNDVTAYSCSGTPVDCVKLAIYEILKAHPDICVSGINHGANSSINVLYSGTMSAAVEGAIEGVPSAGFSLLNYDYAADMTLVKKIAFKVVEKMLNKGLPEGICLNVNVPDIDVNDYKGIKICRQAKAFWEDRFDVRQDPYGRDYFWLTGEFKNFDGDDDTDIQALKNGYVSLVPTQYDMTAYNKMEELKIMDYENKT